MFRRQEMEAPKTPEIRGGELKTRETSRLEKLLDKGKKWLGIVGLTLVSSALVEGAFAREARADEPAGHSSVDASLYKKINLMAKDSGQPAPIDILQMAGQLTNLDDLQENSPADKADALIQHAKKLSTPGVGYTHELVPGTTLRASLDKSEGAYALLTINSDFFLK